MAVTIVSSPLLTPNLISVSYPTVFKLSSDVYGGPLVTQFRFLAEIASGATALGTKYTVVSEAPNVGYIDVANTLRELITLHPDEYGGGGEDWLPKLVGYAKQSGNVTRNYTVTIKEQYYLNGVLTTNALTPVGLYAARGWTDDANKKWLFQNWYQFNGLSNFIPYTGKGKIVYPVRTDAEGWDSDQDYLNILVTAYPGAVVVQDAWFDRFTDAVDGAVYVQLQYPGQTDTDTFTHLIIQVYTSSTPGHSGILKDTYQIDKNLDTCVDEEAIVMFEDRFFQWSFLSFTKKNWTTIQTDPQQAHGVSGRFRYNVDSSDIVTLNTDWVEENINDMFRDLIQTDKSYFVDAATGDIEQVTVVPNSFRLKEARNEGLIQYQISFRKSVDNFKP